MTFFDQKEDVLDIQLTQYGKFLLSKGKLRPASYAFFDDDVIYDSQYADFTESRVDINDRIKETVRPKAQYIFHGAETDIKKKIQIVGTNKENHKERYVAPIPDKHYALYSPLGNSSISEESAPSWTVHMLKGEITGAISHKTSSYHQNMKLPQINTKNAEYKTFVSKASRDDPKEPTFGDFGDQGGSVTSNINFASTRFEDGTYIEIEDDFFLFEVSEENTENMVENFDIEVFIQETDINGKDTYTPLSFKPKRQLVKNGILLDQDELEPETNVLLDSSYVEHFFDVYVDGEINKDVLCSLSPKPDKIASFPSNSPDCDIDSAPRGNTIDSSGLYSSDVSREDTEDDC